MRDFHKLIVWHKAHELVIAVYRETQLFPKEELYGLTSQIRRAAISIPANLAEGCGRNSEIELARFMEIAMGSASELDYHLMLAKDLGYLFEEKYILLFDQVSEVKRILITYIQKLRKTGKGYTLAET